MAPITIDGTDVTEVTIDGTVVREVTVDGDVVYVAADVIEGWESGSIGSEWTVDSSGWSVVQRSELEGDYLLESPSADTFARLWSFEGDGLPYYYGKADGALTFDAYYPGSTSSTENFGWYYGVVDSDNNYFTRHGTNGAELIEKVGGSNTEIGSTSLSLSPDTRYRWEVRWDDGSQGGSDGDHELRVINTDTGTTEATVSANSTNVEDNAGAEGRGLGVWYSSDSVKLTDYLRILPW
jgi:hypothetical protein